MKVRFTKLGLGGLILIFLSCSPNKISPPKIFSTPNAPQPIGPYKQAILGNGFLFISGQIALNPQNNELQNQDIFRETKQVMENLRAILENAGLDWADVVKTTIYMTDLNNFQTMNEVYASYFTGDYAPARETVQVARLPRNANVEISMIAVFLPQKRP
jgi:2-iminobutanoate/2-iminopropanoate deaminase